MGVDYKAHVEVHAILVRQHLAGLDPGHSSPVLVKSLHSEHSCVDNFLDLISSDGVPVLDQILIFAENSLISSLDIPIVENQVLESIILPDSVSKVSGRNHFHERVVLFSLFFGAAFETPVLPSLAIVCFKDSMTFWRQQSSLILSLSHLHDIITLIDVVGVAAAFEYEIAREFYVFYFVIFVQNWAVRVDVSEPGLALVHNYSCWLE